MKIIIFLCVLLAVSALPAKGNTIDVEGWKKNARDLVNQARIFILESGLKRELNFKTNTFCTKWGVERVLLAEEKLDNFKRCEREYLSHEMSGPLEPDAIEKAQESCFFNLEKIFHDAVDQAQFETIICREKDCSSPLKELEESSCYDENKWNEIIKNISDCVYMKQAVETIRYEHDFINYNQIKFSVDSSCIKIGKEEVKIQRQQVLVEFEKCKLALITNLKNMAPMGKCPTMYDVVRIQRKFGNCIREYLLKYRETLIPTDQAISKCEGKELTGMKSRKIGRN